MSVSSSSEFFINMKNPPIYNTRLHYFDQTKDVFQFYEAEYYKICNGVTIGGVFIHPWLYYHLNYFITPIPQDNKEEKLMQPPLRDNEWYFAENYKRAEDEGKGIAMFGSRRFSKSVILSSHLSWKALTRENGKSEVIGGSTPDLIELTTLIKLAMININPAFQLPNNTNDWEKHIKFGLKNKDGVEMPFSQIVVKNADEGSEKASEKGAGGSPVALVLDEFGKWDCIKFYTGALPALKTPTGLKAIPILGGTGGNTKLSADAEKIMSNPEFYQLLTMDWDLLENKIVDKQDITWKRTKFGIFVPAQMVYETGVVKDDNTLDKYLGIENEELANIEIKTTNWKLAKQIFERELELIKNDVTLHNRRKMYYPLDPEWCFLSATDNPFPVQQARNAFKKLIDDGNIGKNVDIFAQADGTLGYEFSTKERIKFPFTGGGIHDAPVILFDDPPKIIPGYGTNVSGLDPYKQKKSGTDSVGSFYIIQRKIDISTPIEIIKASYSSRPNSMRVFHRTVEMLIEGFNAECLMENADGSFLQYLEDKFKASSLLADGVDWSKAVNSNSSPNNNLGYYPTERNKAYILQLVISYCWEEVVVGTDKEGNPIIKLGVEFIPDPDLLQEIIDFKYGGNFDRIVAFGSALAWARWLDKFNIQPRPVNVDEEEQKRKATHIKVMSKGFVPLIAKKKVSF